MGDGSDPGRRDLLKKLGVGAAAWVAPTIVSVTSAAAGSHGEPTTTLPPPPPGRLFDYTGGNRPPLFQPLHTRLATVNELTYVTDTTLPADLATYEIVVLSAHTALFSDDDLALIAGVLAAGGTVLYETDASEYWEDYPQASGSMAAVLNQVSTFVGSTITDLDQTWDTGRRCDVATTIDADVLTTGISALGYGLTSQLAFSSPARRLFLGVTATFQPNQVVAVAQTIGAGTFLAIADVDVVSDLTEVATCETQPATDQFRWNIGHHTPP